VRYNAPVIVKGEAITHRFLRNDSNGALAVSPVPKSEGYFDFAQYRLRGTLSVVWKSYRDRGHPPAYSKFVKIRKARRADQSGSWSILILPSHAWVAQVWIFRPGISNHSTF
jgi:hypothetical protein